MILDVLQVLEGWPCISETLQWAPGCPVYLMGQYAALQVTDFAAVLCIVLQYCPLWKRLSWSWRKYARFNVYLFLFVYTHVLLWYGQVGPHAVNLAGGQAAALRIAKDIIDEHGSEEQNTETTKVEKSRTEEYISHMHGLMWLWCWNLDLLHCKWHYVWPEFINKAIMTKFATVKLQPDGGCFYVCMHLIRVLSPCIVTSCHDSPSRQM